MQCLSAILFGVSTYDEEPPQSGRYSVMTNSKRTMWWNCQPLPLLLKCSICVFKFAAMAPTSSRVDKLTNCGGVTKWPRILCCPSSTFRVKDALVRTWTLTELQTQINTGILVEYEWLTTYSKVHFTHYNTECNYYIKKRKRKKEKNVPVRAPMFFDKIDEFLTTLIQKMSYVRSSSRCASICCWYMIPPMACHGCGGLLRRHLHDYNHNRDIDMFITHCGYRKRILYVIKTVFHIR